MPDDVRNIAPPPVPVNLDQSTDQPISPRHAKALDYARRSIPVFVCEVGGKRPATPHGFKDATTDAAAIDAWFKQADYNIAIEPERAGDPDLGMEPWCVVDIDPKNGGDAAWEALTADRPVTPTYTVGTPSGGRHLYFRGSLPPSSGRIGPGIDTRGRNSYVLAPPSVVSGRAYVVEREGDLAPLPDWIAERLARSPVEPRPAPEGVELDLPYSIAAAERWLDRQPRAAEGIASDLLFKQACRLKDFAISPGKAVELLHARNPAYAEDDIGQRVENAWKHGQNEPGSDRPKPDEEVFAGIEPPPPPEPLGEPIDIFGTIGAAPKLTRAMLPDAPAIEYAFDVAERQGVDPVIPVIAMLATCAAAITDEIKIVRKANDDEHKERAHFNGLIVENVGGGKTPAIKAMTAPLKAVQGRWGETHAEKMKLYKIAAALHKKAVAEFEKRYIGEGLIGLAVEKAAADAPREPVKPVKRYLVLNDATTEGVRDALLYSPHGLLNEQDEMTGFIASWDAYRHDGTQGKDRAFWLQTDGGGPFFVNRAEKADGSGGGVTVPNLSCCFIGGIQPDKLREHAPTLTDDGFIQRAFVFAADDGKRDEQDRAANLEAKRAYGDLIDRLVELGPTHPIRLSPAAHRWRREVEQRAADHIDWPATPPAMKGHLRKWPGKFARLLLLFHVVECVSNGRLTESDVSGETAERARDFMLDFVLPQQLRFYTEFFDKTDAVKSDARWVAGHILAHRLPQITVRDIKRAYHLAPETDDGRVTRAMLTLENAGWVSAAEYDPSKRSMRWPVNPLVHERFVQRAREEKTRRAETMRRIAEAGQRLKAEGKTRAFSRITADEPEVW